MLEENETDLLGKVCLYLSALLFLALEDGRRVSWYILHAMEGGVATGLAL
jgi:hypothetical protein